MGTKTAAANMRSACTALTDTFTEGQSDKASYPYMDAERVYWYYAPINRHGLPLRDDNSASGATGCSIVNAAELIAFGSGYVRSCRV